MKKGYQRIIYLILHGLLFVMSTASFAVPFTIAPQAGTTLPTTVTPGGQTTAYYTVTNITSKTLTGNIVKYLPPNVLVNTSLSTCTPSTYFTLASGGNCTLALTILGAVNANDPNPRNHLLICTPCTPACAGTLFPLNVKLGTAPTVVSVTPTVGAIGVCPSTTVTATFSEAMNPATINTTTFTLTGPGSVPVDGTVIYNGTTASFTPSSALSLTTVYTATITTGAQNSTGSSLASNHVWSFTTNPAPCAAPIPLGAACPFGVLAGTGITNTNSTSVTGDIGSSPTPSITGFPPGTATGTIYDGGPIAANAQSDLTTAYVAAGVPSGASLLSAELGGLTFQPGIYNAPLELNLNGTVVLDGGGDPNSVFIFQVGTTLTTANGSLVTLMNGATAQNVFWQVGTSATLGATSTFEGTIMAMTNITVINGVTLNGRALARNGSVTLDLIQVNTPSCP